MCLVAIFTLLYFAVLQVGGNHEGWRTVVAQCGHSCRGRLNAAEVSRWVSKAAVWTLYWSGAWLTTHRWTDMLRFEWLLLLRLLLLCHKDILVVLQLYCIPHTQTRTVSEALCLHSWWRAFVWNVSCFPQNLLLHLLLLGRYPAVCYIYTCVCVSVVCIYLQKVWERLLGF